MDLAGAGIDPGAGREVDMPNKAAVVIRRLDADTLGLAEGMLTLFGEAFGDMRPTSDRGRMRSICGACWATNMSLPWSR